jgi:hypothetical protein
LSERIFGFLRDDYLGLSSTADALKVSYSKPNAFGGFNGGSMESEGVMKRFELGYHLLLKKIYFNNILSQSNTTNTGFYTQLQPIVAATYNSSNYSGNSSAGGGTENLSVTSNPTKFAGVLYGLNFYFGKNNKTWFFLNVTHNINLTYSTSQGTFSSTTNGTTLNNKVATNGSGFTFYGGLVLYKFKFKK